MPLRAASVRLGQYGCQLWTGFTLGALADSVILVTLVDAVQSLGIIELPAISWINIRPGRRNHVVIFTIAIVLPLADPTLPEEFGAGEPRSWPDRRRLIEVGIPIEDQIRELHLTQMLGNLAWVYLAAIEGEAHDLWIIETHAGSRKERLVWLQSIIGLEGRSPTN